MNIIKDKVLYSPLGPKAKPPNKSFIDRVLSHVKHELKETGDRDWLVDTETDLYKNYIQVYIRLHRMHRMHRCIDLYKKYTQVYIRLHRMHRCIDSYKKIHTSLYTAAKDA